MPIIVMVYGQSVTGKSARCVYRECVREAAAVQE